MADNVIIPPATNTIPVSQLRHSTADKQKKRQSENKHTKKKHKRQNNDGKGHIDEFA